jgi:hypothetical protein
VAITSDGDQDSPGNKVLFPTSKPAIASLVFGIFSIWPLGFIGAIPAVICGHWSLREIKAAQGKLSGAGFARFGLVVGYAILVFLVAAAITGEITLQLLRREVQETFKLQSSQSSQ